MDLGRDVGYASNLPTFICTLLEVVLVIIIIIFLICIYLCLGLKLARNLPSLTCFSGDHATPPSLFLL